MNRDLCGRRGLIGGGLLAVIMVISTSTPARAANEHAAATRAPITAWTLGGDVPAAPMGRFVIRHGLADAATARHRLAREGDRLVFPLFDGRIESGPILRRRARSRTRFTLSGHLDRGTATGAFVVAVNGDVQVAILRLGDGAMYRLRADGGAGHVLEQLDAAAIPTCLAVEGPREPPAGTVAAVDGGGCGTGEVIDVLVVYTPAARDAAGGVAAMEAEIDLALEDNNTAYVNSMVNTEMHLVFAWLVDVDESVVSLRALTDPSDGVMDGVHLLRDAYGADQVAMIRSGSGGVANGLRQLDPSFEATAFCLNGRNSIPGFVVAHELGHQMGCCHARGDGGGCPPQGGLLFPYSNGHRFFGNSGQQWRTVMAYSPGQRFAHFSNPAILFDGQPTGVPQPDPNSADNAATINASALLVSNFRCNDGICESLGLPSVGPDCNDNEVPDACDIARGWSLDENRNGIPDECECLGDVNGDGTVDVLDLLELLQAWGPCPPGLCPADLDGNRIVDVLDLLDLLGRWGPCA